MLPDEVFDEAVIINQLLVVDLCAALQLHFLRVELPFDLDLLEREADKSEHLLSVALELESDVEGARLQHLRVQINLVIAVLREWILRTDNSFRHGVAREVQPGSPLQDHPLFVLLVALNLVIRRVLDIGGDRNHLV